MRFSFKNLSAAGLGLAVTVWIFWLRWPSFHAIWNLDEGIYATIARTILDGGAMYRDAIDQRTPLSYYLIAPVMSVAGPNPLWMLHLFLACLISATALAVFLIARHWQGNQVGIWAVGVFAALSSSLLYPGDAYALNTEWFVIFFTSWSAWSFWRNWQCARFWPLFGTGSGYAAAFLCKQPGLLDFAAPLLTSIYLLSLNRLSWAAAKKILAALVLGFLATTVAVMAYFWWRGALADFYFYAWTYNLVYYGAAISLHDRVNSAVSLLTLLWTEFPVLLFALLAAMLVMLHRLVRWQPVARDRAAQSWAFFLLAWLVLSIAGAASAGRVYGHYYIQTLPAIALASGWLLNAISERVRAQGRLWLRVLCATVAAAAAASLIIGPLKGRARPEFGPDASMAAAQFIKSRSAPSDRVFVWGYHPDFYLYAERRPASRFIYCSFLTGLVPWVNTAPDLDTSATIVPGAMETLLRELETARPEFIVDTSLAPYRSFTKYPLRKFPRLAAFVDANYLEVDSYRFRPHGFRVLMRQDRASPAPLVLSGGPSDEKPAPPSLAGPSIVEPGVENYVVRAVQPGGHLQRLELLIDGAPIAGLSFLPAESLELQVPVDYSRLATGLHQLSARATSASGAQATSPALTVTCSTDSLPTARLPEFSLPIDGAGLIPQRVRAPLGAAVTAEASARVFFAHAPSSLSYELPVGATRLKGRFGFRPGAYAPDNTGHTDGADFVIYLVAPTGQRTELFHQRLRPFEEEADRGEHPFDLPLPGAPHGRTLELVITCGPSGNAASDWTYWSDLQLTTSR